MVSDPGKQAADNAGSSPAEEPSIGAGFTSAAAPDSDSEAEDASARSSRFARMCDRLWEGMRARFGRGQKTYATTDQQEPGDLYKKFWLRHGCGHQVFDCGDCFHISGTRYKPVTKKQLEAFVLSAIKRRDPPWETVYMWDHNGKPDPKMGQAVQSVISEMRAAGKIPKDRRLHVSLDYPCDNMKDFNKFLRDMFRQAAQGGAPSSDPSADPSSRAGIHAPGSRARQQRPGLHAV